MPIRTHRGRAAVYRAVWGWPLRSPRHLAGTVLILAVIAVGVGFALPDDPEPRVAAPSSSAEPNPFDPESRTARAETPTGPKITAPAPAAALAVAEEWVRAFLTAPEGIGQDQWAEQLRPYTTEEMFPELRSIDPANVPQAQVSGIPRTISSGPGSAEVDVPTTAVVVRVLLVLTPEGWRVAGFEQAS